MIVWIDLETTGLDPRKDAICEIAVIVTDDDLNTLATYASVVKTPKRKVRRMDDFVVGMHTKSGLLADLPKATKSLKAIEAEVIALLDEAGVEKRALLGGNSVHFDRGFINNQMPALANKFSHQHLDVSAIGNCVKRWYGDFYESMKAGSGEVAHRAMDDIKSSISQLATYRASVFADEVKG